MFSKRKREDNDTTQKKVKVDAKQNEKFEGIETKTESRNLDEKAEKESLISAVVGNNEEPKAPEVSFESLGLNPSLCEACTRLGWTHPTPIQAQAIPVALQGKDLIGLAQTGSGKTGAYALPILESLLASPELHYACILVPTRELAQQVKEHVEALGILSFPCFHSFFLLRLII
jgi:ATP-dependent RNA helicase DDX47/RRP3